MHLHFKVWGWGSTYRQQIGLTARWCRAQWQCAIGYQDKPNLWSEVGISEFPVRNSTGMIPEVGFSSQAVIRTSQAPTPKSKMVNLWIYGVKVVVISCLLALLLYLCLVKSVVHSALSNFYYWWTCCYTVCTQTYLWCGSVVLRSQNFRISSSKFQLECLLKSDFQHRRLEEPHQPQPQ